jgi:hypothetical protein
MGTLGFVSLTLTHQPPNRPVFHPPLDIFFPAHSELGAYQQVCARLPKDADKCSHARATIATDQFFCTRPVKFHLPSPPTSPVGIGATFASGQLQFR